MSPTPAGTNQKPKLSKTILENQNIFFFEKICSGEDLEDWIRPIRKRLIRLRRQLPKDAKKKFTKELEAFRRSGQDIEDAIKEGWSLEPLETEADSAYSGQWYQQDPSIEKIKVEIDACWNSAKLARQWRERNEMEPKWQEFLQKNFFRAFHEVHNNSNYHEETLVRWELHENLHWNEFGERTDMNPNIRQPTGPKPDFTYAFPIIDTTRKVNLSYLRDSQVESFSLQVLGKLRIKEDVRLKSAPTTKLRKWATDNCLALRAADLICFPWAIVEVKKNKEEVMLGASYTMHNRKIARENEASEQFCYCQAANASAAALTLRENLTAVAKDPSELRDALVIFSFTCIGPSVKLWVTYRGKPRKNSNKKRPITMVCIWATSLELTWGVIALRMVMKNMREWVYAYVKPEISRWIRMVHNRPSPQSFLTPGGDKVVRARRAASCEPLSERPDFALLGSQYRTPRSKVPPVLSQGRTAPESVDRQRFKVCLSDLQQNVCVRQRVHKRGKEEEIEETDSENEADEGYASYNTYEQHEIKSLGGSKSLYAQSSEEEENISSDGEDKSSEEEDRSSEEEDKSSEEEDESGEEEDTSSEDEEKSSEDEDESSEEEDTSSEDEEKSRDGEEHKDWENEGYCYVGARHRPASRLIPKINCSPAKDCKSKNESKKKSKKDQSPRLCLRRRSSRF